MWWSGKRGKLPGPREEMIPLFKQHGFTADSHFVILMLATGLRQSLWGQTIIIFMDNFFSGVKLLEFLRNVLDIGATCTVRVGKKVNKDFPQRLKQIAIKGYIRPEAMESS